MWPSLQPLLLQILQISLPRLRRRLLLLQSKVHQCQMMTESLGS